MLDARARMARAAGERAASLAATEDARRAFDEAAELADDPLERGALLERAGELAADANERELALERLEEASRSSRRRASRTTPPARRPRMSRALWNLGRIDEAIELLERAFAVLAADEPDADVALLAAESARITYFSGQRDAAMERVEFALEIAEARCLPEILSEALNTKACDLQPSARVARAASRGARHRPRARPSSTPRSAPTTT